MLKGGVVMHNFTPTQIKDMAYFDGRLDEFLNDDSLRFKHLVISNMKVVKAFDPLDSALQYAIENFKPGEYIIQQAVNEDDMVNFV
jgi:hypothetical protein